MAIKMIYCCEKCKNEYEFTDNIVPPKTIFRMNMQVNEVLSNNKYNAAAHMPERIICIDCMKRFGYVPTEPKPFTPTLMDAIEDFIREIVTDQMAQQ